MTVTPKGEQFLDHGWQSCLHYHSDVESVLRAATVAMLMGNRRMAVAYLHGTAQEYEHGSNELTCDMPRKKSSPADWYEFMHDSWEKARRQSAARVFREIAEKLEHEE